MPDSYVVELAPPVGRPARVALDMKPCLVYIAGPYTYPDQCVNTHAALRAADELADLDFIPFVPHLTHFWHTMSPKPHSFWLAYDMAWLAKCDALLRLPGKSTGAGKETLKADELGIPVFYSIQDLFVWRGSRKS